MKDAFKDEIDRQDSRRADILALREEVRKLRERQDESFDKLSHLVEAEDRRTHIAADVTRIADSMTRLVEDMHRENRVKNQIIEGLALRLDSNASLNDMIIKTMGVGEIMSNKV